MTRQVWRIVVQLIAIVIVICLYVVLVTRGRVLGELPW
jgi:hypothetical protein